MRKNELINSIEKLILDYNSENNITIVNVVSKEKIDKENETSTYFTNITIR